MDWEEADKMSNSEIFSLLKEKWKISTVGNAIQVVGELRASKYPNSEKYHHRIYNVRLRTGKEIEYPLKLLGMGNTIKSNGIYVSPGVKPSIEDFVNAGEELPVSCELKLATLSERKKHENPMLLMVKAKTVQLLENIGDNDTDLIKDGSGNVLIEQQVVKYFRKKNEQQIEDDATLVRTDLNEKLHNTKIAIEENETILNVHGTALARLLDKTKQKQAEINSLNSEIEALSAAETGLKRDVEIEEDNYMKVMEKFKSFVKDKSDTLLSLEFISEEQYEVVFKILCHSSKLYKKGMIYYDRNRI